MKKSKLFDIFHAIPAKERRLFLEYVRSPYFNKRNDVILLSQYLINRSKENFPAPKMEAIYCWQTIFPNKNFNKKEMAHLMSNLCQLAESFLGQRRFEKKNLTKSFFILEALAEKRLEKHYQLKLKIIKNKIQNSPLEDSNIIWLRYKVAEIEDFHFSSQNQRQINPFITQKNQYLDHFFIQKKLQLFCVMQNIKNTFGAEQIITWPLSPTLSQIPNNQTEVFKAYHFLYQLLTKSNPSETQFLAFKSLLPSLKNKLSHLEYIDMFFFAINYCSFEFNKGKGNYAKHLLSLHSDGLSQGSFLVNNELSPWIYKNIVKLGLGLKRFEWTENFILNYSDTLPENQRKDAFYFNLANLNYYQKNYDQALDYLNQVEFTDVYYKYGAKAILLKIYFEKNETEAFFALESSFKILLMRDTNLPTDLKTTYLNFIRFTSKLFKLKNGDKERLIKLRERIEKTPNINGRNWVVQQLDNIGKRSY